MFKIINSVIRLSGSSKKLNSIQLPAFYSTFLPREFQFETSDGETGTLIHRFSRHIALTKRDFTDPTRYNIKYSSFYPVYSPDHFLKELQNISTHDLGKLICLTSDIRGKSDLRLFTDVVNALDEEAESRVEQASFYELLGMMHGFMYLLPNKITKLKAYRKAMPRFIELFSKNTNAKDFISITFFLGLWKKSSAGSQLMDQFLQEHLQQFLNDDMDLMDFVILANASFKTSVRIRNKQFVELLVKRICEFDGSETSLFVTLVKCARMNRLCSERILEKLRNILQHNAQNLDFRGLSHLFAYVADNLIRDDSMTDLILEECSKHIETEILSQESDSVSQSFRPKDFSTFLWSCATLNIPITQLGIEPSDLLNEVFRKIDNGEYRFIPDTLVDTCLSLWMLNQPSVNMLSSIFGDRQLAQYFKKDRPKIESRRDLLLACAEIEAPEAFKIISKLSRVNAFQLTRLAPEYSVKHRAELQRVKGYLQSLKEKLGISQIEYNVPIKFLNIAGLLVTLDNGELLNVDVLEGGNCLSDKQTPTGLLGLKKRLLDKMNVETVLVNSLNIESEEELVQPLEEAIRNIQSNKSIRQTRKSG